MYHIYTHQIIINRPRIHSVPCLYEVSNSKLHILPREVRSVPVNQTLGTGRRWQERVKPAITETPAATSEPTLRRRTSRFIGIRVRQLRFIIKTYKPEMNLTYESELHTNQLTRGCLVTDLPSSVTFDIRHFHPLALTVHLWKLSWIIFFLELNYIKMCWSWQLFVNCIYAVNWTQWHHRRHFNVMPSRWIFNES